MAFLTSTEIRVCQDMGREGGSIKCLEMLLCEAALKHLDGHVPKRRGMKHIRSPLF
eukprot:CAMPEP_0180533986 /NCGR_PEP_ID=MMETSP1036_2-20121128/63910_1 /TAXON_ID=632150 /ORGANISM="Azadinium spinosum, Strain 3D9" /LENGTH=55 /DNA_ID=CAMNT_0022548221 /DNA_START=20 /DNA_END=187 /DNA_ORIENTATION=-